MKFFKRCFLLLPIFLFFSAPSFLTAQAFKDEEEHFQQLVIPRQLYLGDFAQLQYSFSTPKDLFSIVPHARDEFSVELVLDSKDFESVNSSCTVLDASILRNGNHYIISISFIPWKTGVIVFPEFDLAKVMKNAEYTAAENSSDTFYSVALQAVTVESLASKMNAVSLRPPLSPVTLPGTNYVLWAIIFGIALFIFLLAVFLARLSHIINAVKLIRQRFSFLRNSIITRLHLIVLLKSHRIKDTDFALAWQKIMRSYLSFRFGINFDAVSASKIGGSIVMSASGFISDRQQTAVDTVSSFFIRTDYIKFACGSIDSRLLPAEEHEAVFSKNERLEIVKKTIGAIQIFESEEKQNDSV